MGGSNHSETEDARLFEAIAHDMNNLLAAIDGYADQVGGALPPNHTGQGDVQQIHRAVKKASILIGLCRGLGPTGSRRVELVEIAQMAARLLRKLRTDGGEVRVEGISASAAVRGDGGALLEALLHVAGGEDGAGPPVLLPVERGSLLGIRVAFPGGADPGSTAPGRTRELLTAMSGELVRSDAGWDILLPAADDAPSRERRAPRLRRVLLAEPEGLLRSFFVSALDAEHVEEVVDGERAHRILSVHAPPLDLVVVPVDLDGFDALAGYRELRSGNAEAVLVLIGRSELFADELRRLVENDRRTIVVDKPFNVAQLVRLIDELLREPVDTNREVSP